MYHLIDKIRTYPAIIKPQLTMKSPVINPKIEAIGSNEKVVLAYIGVIQGNYTIYQKRRGDEQYEWHEEQNKPNRLLPLQNNWVNP